MLHEERTRNFHAVVDTNVRLKCAYTKRLGCAPTKGRVVVGRRRFVCTGSVFVTYSTWTTTTTESVNKKKKPKGKGKTIIFEIYDRPFWPGTFARGIFHRSHSKNTWYYNPDPAACLSRVLSTPSFPLVESGDCVKTKLNKRRPRPHPTDVPDRRWFSIACDVDDIHVIIGRDDEYNNAKQEEGKKKNEREKKG